MDYRDQLMDMLTLHDNDLLERFLNGEEITSEMIENSIRNILQNNPKEFCPIFVGSSLKNKGI